MSRHIPRIALVVALAAVGAAVYASGALGTSSDPDSLPEGCDSQPVQLEMRVLREFAHDNAAFTQGLAFRGEELFESTGLRGRSDIRRLDPATGDVLASADLADDLFAEGLTASGEKLVQITWTSGLAIRWDYADGSFSEVGTFGYEGEGWGLATGDSGELLMSDGTDGIQIRDAESFELLRELPVFRDGGEVGQLNELESGQGRLWANQWKSNEILRIRTDCGDVAVVDAFVDASELEERAGAALAGSDQSMDVLNGIAHVDDSRYLLTGKRWPLMFEVELSEPAGQ